MTGPPELDYAAVRSRIGPPLRAANSPFQANLFPLEWEGEAAVLKDLSASPWPVRQTWARIVIAREARVMARVRGIEGTPRLIGRAGPFAYVMERLEARPLPRNRDAPPDPLVFGRAWKLLDRLHARGIGHGDLRRKNILIDAEGRPWLIDFATAVTSRPGWAGAPARFLFRRMRAVDRIKLARLHADYYPDDLSAEERALIAGAPGYLGAVRWLKRNVFRLRKARHRRRLFARVRGWLRGKRR